MPLSEGVVMHRSDRAPVPGGRTTSPADGGARTNAAPAAGLGRSATRADAVGLDTGVVPIDETPGGGMTGPDAGVGGAVRRDLLRDAVFTRLVHRILRGEYRSGQRLRLDGIAAELGVSRTPVREALVPLEALRLVQVQRYVGVVIAPWTPAHMVERVQIAQGLLAVPYPTSSIERHRSDPPVDVGAFDATALRACRSDAGRFAVLAEWTLRRLDRPVSADWLAAQLPVLDAFYMREVAGRHGLDVAVGAAERASSLASALGAVWDEDLVAAIRHLDAFADALAAFDRGTHRRDLH
ncbi:hypothetical protein DEI92_13605 [Curtobacterium sp. MCBD17_034]|nr:hypothetical protein DEI92_13605 [Curtobacterium sp. MCBD17_034]PZM33463.1 hypothetical protein DEI90_12195 [Curtobacterium sp. MCBD17_031]